MESNSDSPLLETLVESLQPSNSDLAILSTCNFLQTVVVFDFPGTSDCLKIVKCFLKFNYYVFDFPAETFLYHRQLFIVRKLSMDTNLLILYILM